MIIGITGNSGTGKTTASGILAKELNAEIINADEIVKKEQKNGLPYYNAILKSMGTSILLENLEINRKMLAKIIYENKKKRTILNEITKYYIGNKIKEQLKYVKREHVILDAPLLFESNLDKICDETISLIAKENVKINRICKRENIDNVTAKKRLKIQPKDEFYINKSNYIIINNEENIEEEIKKVWEKICSKHGKN